ncbi:MAG TPA: DMT family transporter [Pyrinomonadaceae bacterium]|nr:DMT family transporter [Pyrinomonadaceae bacterium]
MDDPSKKDADRGIAPHLALCGVQVFFGSLPVIGKVVLAVIPALALVGFRVGITAGVLLLIQLYRGRVWLQHRGDYLRLAVLSLFGVVFNQLLFIGGLSLTKAANTSLLAVTIPIATLLVSAAAGFEKLRVPAVIGVVIAAAGVVLLIDPRAASFSSQTTIGDLMIVVNSLSYGIYVATSKDVITRNGAFRSMMWVFIFASVVCVPVGVMSLATIDASTVRTGIWLLVVYIAVAATAAPYLLNAWALARLTPSTVAVFIYLQPLIGFALAVIFLGEAIDFRFIIAALLVFAGVFMTTRRTERAAIHVTG